MGPASRTKTLDLSFQIDVVDRFNTSLDLSLSGYAKTSVKERVELKTVAQVYCELLVPGTIVSSAFIVQYVLW